MLGTLTIIVCVVGVVRGRQGNAAMRRAFPALYSSSRRYHQNITSPDRSLEVLCLF